MLLCFCNNSGGFFGRALAPGDCIGRADTGIDAEPSTGQQTVVRSVHDPLRDATTSSSGSRVWELRVLPGAGDPSTTHDVDPLELQVLSDYEFDVLPVRTPMLYATVGLLSGSLSSCFFCFSVFLISASVSANSLLVYRRPEMNYQRSDRMAVCLSVAESSGNDTTTTTTTISDGSAASVLVGGQQMSEPCVSGTIQLPPDGNPLILLAEHQTTGGYKVPGVVIKADLWQVGQMRPGDKLRFVPTSPETATAALRSRWMQAHECTEVEEDSEISP